MPTHLSCLGFRVSDQTSLEDLLVRLAADADQFPCAEGVYLRWLSDAGPEIWLLCHPKNGLIGFNPHFHGAARVIAARARAFERPERTVLDGALVVRTAAAGAAGAPEGADLVFDMPDFRLGARLLRQEPLGMHVTAFAHSVRSWPSAADYTEAPPEDAPALAIGSFLATGLAWDRSNAVGEPPSQAVMVGRVERTERLDNPLGGEFVWAEVATDVGSFDVVADPELLSEPLVAEGVVRGRFWLSGRVREFVERKAPDVSLRVFRG